MSNSPNLNSARNEKVLIVDDSRIMRDFLRKMLAELGFNNFVEADSAQDTLAKYNSEQPKLIFLDIELDEDDGLAVFEQLLAIDSLILLFVSNS